jgi:hypothetical protein
MERLTIRNDNLGLEEISFVNPNDPEGMYNILDLAKRSECGNGAESGVLLDISTKLAEYEDTELEPEEIMHLAELKLQGRLVELPFKVGDTVYRTVTLVNGMTKVVKGMISDFSRDMFCNKDHIYFKDSPIFYNIWLDADEFGKTVFLTKEEAEQALNK